MDSLGLIYNLCAIALLLLSGFICGAVFARYSWMWYIAAIAVTFFWVPFVYKNGTGSLEKLYNICLENVFCFVCTLLACVAIPCAYFIIKNYFFDRESRLTDEKRQDYIFKSHEAFTKEVAAARTLITTLASGSFVTLRALSSVKTVNIDLSNACLFCLISVFCVLCATFSSIISLHISMTRLSDYDIENKDVKTCNNFFEHVFLFWSAVTLLIGYGLFASCYVK